MIRRFRGSAGSAERLLRARCDTDSVALSQPRHARQHEAIAGLETAEHFDVGAYHIAELYVAGAGGAAFGEEDLGTLPGDAAEGR